MCLVRCGKISYNSHFPTSACEIYCFPFFGLTTDMEASGIDELPAHTSIRRDVYAGRAAADELVLIKIFHTAAIAVGRFIWCEPGLALVAGDDAVLFTGGIMCKVSSDDDQVVFILYGNRIGAGGFLPLYQGQVDLLIADEQPAAASTTDEAGFIFF